MSPVRARDELCKGSLRIARISSKLIDLSIKWNREAEGYDANGNADCGTGSDVPYALAEKCYEHARELEQIAYEILK